MPPLVGVASGIHRNISWRRHSLPEPHPSWPGPSRRFPSERNTRFRSARIGWLRQRGERQQRRPDELHVLVRVFPDLYERLVCTQPVVVRERPVVVKSPAAQNRTAALYFTIANPANVSGLGCGLPSWSMSISFDSASW